MPGADTAFLVDTVGDALAKGVAATTIAQPADPVEYLAQWLIRCGPGFDAVKCPRVVADTLKPGSSTQARAGTGVAKAAPAG